MQNILYEVLRRCRKIYHQTFYSPGDSLNNLIYIKMKREEGLWFKIAWETMYLSTLEFTIYMRPDHKDNYFRFP